MTGVLPKGVTAKQFPRGYSGPLIFILAVALAWSVIGLNTWNRMRRIEAATATSRFDLPEKDPASPTGYKGGLRTVVLERGTDGYHWIMAAQRMAAEGIWRARWSPDDNAPDGRSMHWSQPLLWWMIALGAFLSRITGLPFGAAIEQCAVWSTVPIHMLLVLAIPLSIRRAFGWTAAGILAAAMGCVYPFASLFFAGAPDHHGFVAAALLATALFLAAALIGSKKWAIASGMAAGVSLWISAASAMPALVFLQCGAALSLVLWGKDLPDPRLWRTWGMAAALSAFSFYLLEYFPGWMQMRLEINHPLYSLEILGAGEILCQLGRWRQSGFQAVRPLPVALSMVAVILLPAVVFFQTREVFIVRDPFLWALHKEYIHEFRDLAGWIRFQHPEALVVSITPLFLLGPAAFWLILRRVAPEWKAGLLTAGAAAIGMFALGVVQVRWMNMAESLWLALLPIVAAIIAGRCAGCHITPLAKWAGVVFCTILFLQMPQRIVRDTLEQAGTRPRLTADELAVVSAREIAYRLRALGGRDVPVVAAGPTTTTWMMYFGGLKGIGTLYWENLVGLKSAAALYAANTDEEARQAILRHGVTYMVFLWTEPFAAEYPRLLCGLPPGPPLEGTLAAGLVNAARVPSWARPMPMPAPDELPDSWVWVYDVRQAAAAPR